MENPYNCVEKHVINSKEVIECSDNGEMYAGRWSRKYFASDGEYPLGYYTHENGSLEMEQLDENALFDTTVIYGQRGYGIDSQIHNLSIYASLNNISMCHLYSGQEYEKDILRSLPSNVIDDVSVFTLTTNDDMVSFISDVITEIENKQFVFIKIDSLLDQRNMRSRSRRLFNRVVDVLYHRRMSNNDTDPLILSVDPLDFFLDKYTDLQSMVNDLQMVNVGRIFRVEYPQQRLNKHKNVLLSANNILSYNVGSPGNEQYISQGYVFNPDDSLLELKKNQFILHQRNKQNIKLTSVAKFPPTRSIREVEIKEIT